MTRQRATCGSVRWIDTRSGYRLPSIDTSLSQWTVDKRRASHWNGHRCHDGRMFFLKWFLHRGLSAPARTEWANAQRLARMQVPTVIAVGWGRHPRGSFCVFEGSPGFPADTWHRQRLSPYDLHALAKTLASYVSRLHDARLCHRDLNVYHVLIHDGAPRIIDVGRVCHFARRRWIIKDLASLLDSARREGMPAAVARTFLASYLRETRRRWSRRKLLQAVDRKARRYRRHNEKRGR